MRKLGGVIGAVVAIALLFIPTEWLWVDWFNENVGDTIGTAVALLVGIAGWMVGSRVAGRIAGRHRTPPPAVEP